MSEASTRMTVGYRGDPVVTDLPMMLVTPALFAANMVAARWAESATIPPVFLAFGRWVLAFLFLFPSVAPRLWACRKMLMTNWPQLLLLSALGMGVAVAPQYIGARHTSAANIALIFAACPVLVTLIEAVVWKSPLKGKHVGGMLLAISGVLVVLSKGDIGALGNLRFGRGDPWVMLAASGWALYTVMSKRHPLPPLPATVRLAALAAGGAVILAPFAILEASGGTMPDFGDPRLYAALCFLAIVPSLGAYFCFDRLVARTGAAGASLSMYIVPFFAAFAAWPLLGEAPRAFHIIGAVLILGGVVVAGMHAKAAEY